MNEHSVFPIQWRAFCLATFVAFGIVSVPDAWQYLSVATKFMDPSVWRTTSAEFSTYYVVVLAISYYLLYLGTKYMQTRLYQGLSIQSAIGFGLWGSVLMSLQPDVQFFVALKHHSIGLFTHRLIEGTIYGVIQGVIFALLYAKLSDRRITTGPLEQTNCEICAPFVSLNPLGFI